MRADQCLKSSDSVQSTKVQELSVEGESEIWFYSYPVRLKMINNAGEVNVATLDDRVVFQGREKLRKLFVSFGSTLTCNYYYFNS